MLFTRRSSRLKRREADALLAAGTPVVLYDYASGLLEWCDGDDALMAWAAMRGSFTSDTPRPRGDVVWTGGVWESVDDPSAVVVVLTGHC